MRVKKKEPETFISARNFCTVNSFPRVVDYDVLWLNQVNVVVVLLLTLSAKQDGAPQAHLANSHVNNTI